MHGHISHPETIVDPIELTDKEAGCIRERSGLLLLHICGTTEENLYQHVSGWRKKTAENTKEFRAMYGITLTRGAQVTFPSPQSYEMTPRVTNHLSSSEQMDNTPIHQGVDVGRRFPLQSPGQLPPQPRFNINPQYGTAESSSDDQEPRTSTAPRRISATTPDPMLAPQPRSSIGEMATAFNIGQQQQRSSQGFQGQNDERRGYLSGYGSECRASAQDVRSRQDDDHSQDKNAVSVASYLKDRHYSGQKNESFETLLLRYETCARQLSLKPKQMSMCFPNALEGTALDFFHTHLSMDSPFPKIVQVMSRQFNSEHR